MMQGTMNLKYCSLRNATGKLAALPFISRFSQPPVFLQHLQVNKTETAQLKDTQVYRITHLSE